MGGRVISDDEDEGYEEQEDVNPVDQDAAEEEEEDRNADDDDEEEEYEDGRDEYEKDGFIVDDDEEEEPEEDDERGNSDEERHKKKKRKKRHDEKNYVLDEDDYELLEDNNIGFHRPKAGSTKFKRLKKAGRGSAGGEHSGFSDEEETDGKGQGGKTAEEKLKRSLFGDDESAPLEDIAEEEEQQEEEEDVDLGEEDEMADFIVDEEEEIGEDGAPVRRKKIKKKKHRQAPGVSSSALQEAHEIFGDVDELLSLRKKGLANSSRDSSGWSENRLENEFEPEVIEKNYMTQRDEQIRDTDVPERIQLSEEITGPPPTDSQTIKEEAAWIYNELVPKFPVFFSQVHEKEHKEHIFNVLSLYHSNYDIPFIAMYRKELCFSLLNDPDEELEDEGTGSDGTPKLKFHKILYAIQNLDVKWLLIQKRKNALVAYYTKRFEEEARRIDDETRLAIKRSFLGSVIDFLKVAKSEREVSDVDLKFNLHFPPGEVDEGQFKRPTRRSYYSECCKNGLWEVANKFGRSSEQFGIALEKMFTAEELEDAKEGPDEIAINFTCARFREAKDVLDGARHMASVEMSCEPSVRKHVRTTFMSNAVVTTSPTAEGNTIIDSSHQFYGVKWLKDKPLSRFVDAQWLLVQKAEEEKLIQVTIKLPESVQDKLMGDFRTYYLSENLRKSAQLWNEQRELILNDSFFNHILPSMEKEARSQLTSNAKNWLLKEYGTQLWKKISVGPYQNKNTTSEEESAPRVMACCWGPGKPATTFVMLDSAGEVLDVLYAGSINARSQGIHEQRKKNDQQRLLKFMTDHQPDVICVGAANVQCRTLKDEINEIIYNILEDHPREVGSDFELVPVFADEALPRLYENSNISSDQLPGQPGIVKRAVALGRYIQNPLAMVATLCGRDREILSWKLCPLENYLTSDEKYGIVEQVMVDATNQVGIDINMACSHEWLFAPLQFVSGLGPRKASALQRALVRAGSVFSRKEIAKGVLRKRVFVNAIGFFRVRRSGTASISSHIMDLLDDTRIHPESYELAKRMAKDVYAEDHMSEDANEIDDETQEMLIEHVREKPHQLRALIIEKYAASVEEETGTRKRETLSDIRRELLHGFEDWRIPYSEPNADEQFQMISGETDESISEGRIVQVSVRFVQDQRVVCQFDSGLKGMISIADFSDRHLDSSEMQEMVHEGDVLTCKVKSVDTARCLVYLTHRPRDLERPYTPKDLDDFFIGEHTVVRSEHDKARKDKERAKRHFKPRMIEHPQFKNYTADEAMEHLSNKEAGESIIRPSSKGPSHLTLTLKVYDGVYAHKEIVEGDKDHKNFTSLLSIGKKLTIGDDTFEDLDELMHRYVEPLVSHLKNMLGYRKFRKGTKSDVDALLRVEKTENPMRIVYGFGISYEYPGSFILTYIRSSNPHHEYVGLYPRGFRFRKREFDNIDRLVAHFQKHIDDVPSDTGLSMKSLAAVVPIRSPAGGGSGGGSSVDGNWSDGWRGQADSDGERSTPVSRGSSRFDRRNNNMGDVHHPSGIPRPFGRGRGRGRGKDREGQDSDYGYSKFGSGSSDKDDGLSSFPGAKFQNSPGREKFPGSWAGNSGGGGSTWGGSSSGGGAGGWGGHDSSQDNRDSTTAGHSWGGSGTGTGGGWASGTERGNKDGWGGSGDGNNSSSWDQSGGDKAQDGYNSNATAGNAGWDASKRVVPAQTESRGGWSGGGGSGW